MRVDDPVLEIGLFWNEKSRAMVLTSFNSFKGFEIYELLIIFLYWVCDPRIETLSNQNIKIISSSPDSREQFGDLVIYDRIIGENIVDAFSSTQRTGFKLIPLPTNSVAVAMLVIMI